jgi:hypothetical protein
MRALAVIFAVAASAALAQPNPDQTLSAVVAVSAKILPGARWSWGAAGMEVPLKVLRGTQLRELTVRSIDRVQYFRNSTAY